MFFYVFHQRHNNEFRKKLRKLFEAFITNHFKFRSFDIFQRFCIPKASIASKNKIKMKRKKSLGNSQQKLWHTFQDILLHSSSSFSSSFAYPPFDVFCSNRLSGKCVTRVSSLSKERRQKDIEVICLEASLNYRKYATCSETDHESPFFSFHMFHKRQKNPNTFIDIFVYFSPYQRSSLLITRTWLL